MKVEKSESGSDVSSDSSWTVIEELQETIIADTGDARNTNINSDIDVVKSTEVLTCSDVPNEEDNDFVQVTLSKTDIKEYSDEESGNSKHETKENGFLTFDEYLQERMLEHDYDYPSQSIFRRKLTKSKKFPKNKRKCKAETIGVLSLCASLLTVTGIGLLCLIFPENIDTNNFETIKSNCQAIASNGSLDYSDIAASFNRTLEVLEAANNSKLLPKCAESVSRRTDYKYRPARKAFGPMNEIVSSRYRSNRKRKNIISVPNIFENDVCYPKSNNGVCYVNEDPRLTLRTPNKRGKRSMEATNSIDNTNRTMNDPLHDNKTTSLTTIESVLTSTNLKKIIRSIIHDICILKLVTYLNKNTEPRETTKKKSNKGEHKASKRKLLEDIADGMERICYEECRERRVKTAKRKNKTKKPILQRKDRLPSTSVIVTPTSSKGTWKQNFPSLHSHDSPIYPIKPDFISKFENGKSECERRFEDLDNQKRKSQDVCSKHKINIQQIKAQYRNEIDAIRDSNIEPMLRLHKIQNLREKYRVQLKKNREIFLKEMGKMKRARAKMLRDLCAQKRMDLEMKDVAVGSYVVPIDQDFQSRLQQMKQKENFRSDHSIFQDFQRKTEPIFKLPSSLESSFKFGQFQLTPPLSVGEHVSNGAIKKSRDCKKPRMIALTPKVHSVLSVETTNNCLQSCHTSNEITSLDNEKDDSPKKFTGDSKTEIVRADDKKKIQSHLYQIAFEKKGSMIENLDNVKWHQRKEDWHKYKRDSSKQDPQKSYKPNIMVYKAGKL